MPAENCRRYTKDEILIAPVEHPWVNRKGFAKECVMSARISKRQCSLVGDC